MNLQTGHVHGRVGRHFCGVLVVGVEFPGQEQEAEAEIREGHCGTCLVCLNVADLT